jgi:eukaryotic-like serine/threonine-protein kinase
VEPKPEPKVEPKPEPKVEPKPEPKVEPKPEPKLEPKPEPASADEVRCPRGMTTVTLVKFAKGTVRGGKVKGAQSVALAKSGKAYCVDTHEYPGAGRRPRTSITHTAAAGLCRSAGKRLCSDREWRRACGGAFPYGRKFNAGRCNTEDDEGEERSLTNTGKFRRCRSGWGVYDMSGNAAEWTADQTVRGGDFASADEDAACGAGGRRSASSARSSIGFRCCADFK